MFSNENTAMEFLKAGHVFFPFEDDVGEQEINLNDVFGWACADSEPIPDSELVRVADLFWSYGWCGILWWVSQRRGNQQSEFHDVNRFIEFVAHEEAIREETPDSSTRAYARREYTIGSSHGNPTEET